MLLMCCCSLRWELFPGVVFVCLFVCLLLVVGMG